MTKEAGVSVRLFQRMALRWGEQVNLKFLLGVLTNVVKRLEGTAESDEAVKTQVAALKAQHKALGDAVVLDAKVKLEQAEPAEEQTQLVAILLELEVAQKALGAAMATAPSEELKYAVRAIPLVAAGLISRCAFFQPQEPAQPKAAAGDSGELSLLEPEAAAQAGGLPKPGAVKTAGAKRTKPGEGTPAKR